MARYLTMRLPAETVENLSGKIPDDLMPRREDVPSFTNVAMAIRMLVYELAEISLEENVSFGAEIKILTRPTQQERYPEMSLPEIGSYLIYAEYKQTFWLVVRII